MWASLHECIACGGFVNYEWSEVGNVLLKIPVAYKAQPSTTSRSSAFIPLFTAGSTSSPCITQLQVSHEIYNYGPIRPFLRCKTLSISRHHTNIKQDMQSHLLSCLYVNESYVQIPSSSLHCPRSKFIPQDVPDYFFFFTTCTGFAFKLLYLAAEIRFMK